MTQIDCNKIFVPGGFPERTYYSRSELKLEEKIKRSSMHSILVVSGHTKLGKTVLVRNLYPKNEKDTVWIDGGTISSIDDLWDKIIVHYDEYHSEQISQHVDAGVNAKSRVPFFTGGGHFSEGSSHVRKRDVGKRVKAIDIIEKNKPILIIDDFHYIKKEIQKEIIQAFKPLIFEGVRIILIVIPHKRYDSAMVEKEMTGRINIIEIPSWKKDELIEIPKMGFEIMGVEVPEKAIKTMVENSLGSPHLMQQFCYEFCMDYPDSDIESVLKRIAQNMGRPMYDKISRGPRQRSDRKIRNLINGDETDIYGLILHALAHIKPSLETLEYEQIRKAIREIAKPNSIPQMHEVTRVLEKMSEIASADRGSVPAIDFDKENERLHITDPFFAFFLRWGILEV